MNNRLSLPSALSEFIDRYVARTPASRTQFENAQRHLPGGNTRSVLFYEPYPLAIRRGQGCTLWDVDANQYVDFLSEFTAGLYGHSNPVIRAAIQRALDDGISLSGHNLLESRLADLICERFGSVEALRFTNSGTEANLFAIAAAKAFTGRSKVMVFEGGYHGGVLTFVSGNSRVNVPHDFLLAPYNDVEAVRKLYELHASELAAVLVEPMQGAAGCIPATSSFMTTLRHLTNTSGALLIHDEVMTSRLALGGLQQQLNIVPDMTTLGKYIGGGVSFGAFGGRRDVMAQFDPRRSDSISHAGTFNNNVLSMSAGIAGLEQLYTKPVVVALNQAGDALRQGLNAICRHSELNMQFTGMGSLMNFHPTAGKIERVSDLSSADNRVRDLFFFFMIERGIYVARRGFVVLSLPITSKEIDRFLAAFRDFATLYASLVPE